MKYSHLILTVVASALIWGCASTLQKSAAEGDRTKVDELIAEGQDVNARDGEGWTPIYYAIRNNHPEVVEALITAGADLNVRDMHGQPPLSLAVVYCDAGTAEDLIKAGAEVNAEDSLQWTPLHNAALEGRLEMVSLLIWLGAEVNPRNSVGWTPLDLAVRHRHPAVIEILLENGGIGYSYEAMEFLLEKKRRREQESMAAAPAAPPEIRAVREEVYDDFNEQTAVSLTHSIESLKTYPLYREYRSIVANLSGDPIQFYQAGRRGWLIGPWQTVTLSTDGDLYPSIRLGVTFESTRYYFFSSRPAQFKIGDGIFEAARTRSLADMDGDLVVARGEFLLTEKLVGAIQDAPSLTIRVQFDNSPTLTWPVPAGVLGDWKLFFADAERLFRGR